MMTVHHDRCEVYAARRLGVTIGYRWRKVDQYGISGRRLIYVTRYSARRGAHRAFPTLDVIDTTA